MTPYDTAHQMIALYHEKGLNAVRSQKWVLGNAWRNSESDNPLTALNQWRVELDVYDEFANLVDAVQQYARATREVILSTVESLHNNDWDTLSRLNAERADVVCAEVFRLGMLQQRKDWLQWACQNVGKDWDHCFAWVLDSVLPTPEVTPNSALKIFQTLLGGWCNECNSVSCGLHPTGPFLNAAHRASLLHILDTYAFPGAYMPTPLSVHARAMIEGARHHPTWDNTNPQIQEWSKKILLKAAQCGDTVALPLLLGPNDRRLSEEERKTLVCANRDDITYVLVQQCHTPKVLEQITPFFIGLVDGERLRGNRYLTTFLEQHDALKHQWLCEDLAAIAEEVTSLAPKRKM